MVASIGFASSFTLPWTVPREENRRFRRILYSLLALLLVLSVAMPFLPVAELPEPPPLEEPVRHYVTLLPPQLTPTPAPRVEAQAAQQAEIRQQPAPRPAPAPAPSPAPEREAVVPDAREQAQQSGILAMRESLSSLRRNPTPGAANRGELSQGGDTAREVERSVLTSRVGRGSEGINVGTLSRGLGGGGSGGGLGERDTTRVQSPIGLAAGSGGGSGRSNKMASRTDEEIQLVFDRNKGSIFGIYNRALRVDSSLQGKMVLRLTILPSGEVSDIGIVSSELGDQALERRLLLRIRGFNFGAKEVETVTVTYPIEFFPS